MLKYDPNSSLNRLLVIVYRAFPMYLADAVPWTHTGDTQAKEELALLVTDYRMYAGRLTEMLFDRRAIVGFGEYPMGFTDTHDLSLDYLIGELVFYQKQDIAAIQQCAGELQNDPHAQALAEEILGNARGHLQSLEELVKQPAAAT